MVALVGAGVSAGIVSPHWASVPRSRLAFAIAAARARAAAAVRCSAAVRWTAALREPPELPAAPNPIRTHRNPIIITATISTSAARGLRYAW